MSKATTISNAVAIATIVDVLRLRAETQRDELMRRVESLEQDVRHDWEARGYEEGLADGLREAMPYNGPLD